MVFGIWVWSVVGWRGVVLGFWGLGFSSVFWVVVVLFCMCVLLLSGWGLGEDGVGMFGFLVELGG